MTKKKKFYKFNTRPRIPPRMIVQKETKKQGVRLFFFVANNGAKKANVFVRRKSNQTGLIRSEAP